MRRVWKRALAGAGVVVAAGAAWLAWPDDLFYPRLVPAASAPAANVAVGPNVHVSKPHEEHAFTECVLAADPNRPGRLFAASMYWPRGREDGTNLAGYLSDDGGATWATSVDLVADRAKKERLNDPTAAFGPDGELYFVHMRVDSRRSEVVLGTEGEAKTLDWLALPTGGATNWELRGRVNRYIDRPWLTVDHTAGPNRGRLYCSANINALYFLTSADGGRTVTTPPMPSRHWVKNPYPTVPVVLSDGTALAAFRCGRHRGNPLDPQQTPLFRSTDGGQSLAQAGEVGIYWKHPAYGPVAGNTEGFTPGLAVDPGSPGRADALYYVWAQRLHPRPHTERVLFTRSTDRGTTWSDPVVLSEQADDPAPADDYVAYMPCVAVNKAGVVAVTWYDRRGLPPQVVPKSGPFPPMRGWNVRMRVSLDGGATWPPSVPVNSAPSTGELAGWHTAGLAADGAGRFHPAWTDDRTGRAQLWTATVEVTP